MTLLLFCLSGDEQNSKVWSGVSKYNLDTKTWTSLASTKEPRTQHSCLLFNHPSIGQQVMVAGGNTANWAQTSTAEVYSVVSNEWSYLTPVPSNARLVQISRSNVLSVFDNNASTLYQYSSEEDTWVGYTVKVSNGELKITSNVLFISEYELISDTRCT